MAFRFRKMTIIWATAIAGVAILGMGTLAAAPAGAASLPNGTLTLSPLKGEPGTVVYATGSGFAAGAPVALTWQAVSGSWDVTTSGVFLGANYTPSYVPVASVTTSAAGSFATSFKVPSGFGFTHNVLVSEAGQTVGSSTFDVKMSLSVSPRSGPVGTPIHIKLSGIGYAEYQQDWNLLYDNRLTGWLSAVTTNGTARVTIPATGALGLHELAIYPGSDREPYLNTQQAPTGNPTFHFAFTVTAGSPVLPRTALAQTPRAKRADAGVASDPAGAGAKVWLDDLSASPGTMLTLEGHGFPAGQTADVLWATQKGSHLTSLTPVNEQLTTVQTSATGTLQATLRTPSDLGGAHAVTVQVGSSSASTSLIITPQDEGIFPSSGRVGTDFTIHLRGVGVSWIANTYGVTYDDGDIGYVCGVNSGGNVILHLRAAGAPGWHFIDLYPAIWKIATVAFATADYFQVPQLTYATDNPGGRVPMFQFAFDVTS